MLHFDTAIYACVNFSVDTPAGTILYGSKRPHTPYSVSPRPPLFYHPKDQQVFYAGTNTGSVRHFRQSSTCGGGPLRILHTADWHLGMTLCGKRRDAEAEEFLTWLTDLIQTEDISLLLVTGDIFDTGTPSARSQTLYYQFLTKAAAAGCRHIIITAGNHDSPAFLEAPHEILAALNIHIVGRITDEEPGGTYCLAGENETPECIVVAVPYLRDRDLRRSESGTSVRERAARVRDGVREVYREAWEAAVACQPPEGTPLPIVMTGHLFAAGGRTVDGDGVRDQVAGFIERVGADIFPDAAAYVALGHLHVPQSVRGNPAIRYPGSPLAVGFGEADQQKEVVIVTVAPGSETTIKSVPVPQFRRLATIRGDFNDIARRIADLKETGAPVWAEVIYEGDAIIGDLMGAVAELAAGSDIAVLRVRDARLVSEALAAYDSCEDLEALTVEEVFARRMKNAGIPAPQQERLMDAFREVLSDLKDEPDGDTL